MSVLRIVCLCLTLALLACTDSASTDPSAVVTSNGASTTTAQTGQGAGKASQDLHELFEDYFEQYLVLNPVFATFIGDNRYNDSYANDISPQWRQSARQLEEEALQRARSVDATGLDATDALSLQIFIADRETAVEAFDFREHLTPINQSRSVPNQFIQLGSGSGIQPFNTVADYDSFLGRIDGFLKWMKQAETNMREGISQGYTQPRILMEKVLPQLESQLVGRVEDSEFYRPVLNMPDGFSAAKRDRLAAAYESAIMDQLVPAYRALRDFIRDEYLPVARETVGLNALPDGQVHYDYLVRRNTTTDLQAAEIHAIGLREVDRIHTQMRDVMAEVGFEGDLDEFFTYVNSDPKFFFTDRQDLLDGYKALRVIIEPNAPTLFNNIPRADFEIRLVEPFREKTASGGQYRGASPDGSRPGVFFANAYDLSARPRWAMESLFLHEAIPGHHFQGALTLELDELPRFRQFGGYTAYGEGWGLYAESLGRELGVYTDPYQYFGKLNAELWRSIRLVVDTGIHHFGWSRQQVLEYMYANSAVAETRAVSEAERFMARPGQALAYKIGQLKIQQLRERAEAAMGEAFDIRAFHEQILGAGELPLNVLDQRVSRWIQHSRQTL